MFYIIMCWCNYFRSTIIVLFIISMSVQLM